MLSTPLNTNRHSILIPFAPYVLKMIGQHVRNCAAIGQFLAIFDRFRNKIITGEDSDPFRDLPEGREIFYFKWFVMVY